MRLASLALIFAVAPALLVAQEHPIALVVKAPAQSPQPGSRFNVVIAATIPPGWHLYSITQPQGGPIATTMSVGPDSVFRLAGPINAPVPQIAADPNFGIVTEWHEDAAEFKLPVIVARTVRNGAHTLEARIGYQTCNARYCLPPTEDTLLTKITVEGRPIVASGISTDVPANPPTAARPAPARAPAPAPAEGPAPESVKTVRGTNAFLLYLWLAATMGALSLLTPCVFPMVPITISYFSRSDGRSRTDVAASAALYAGGIVAAFTLLGLGLSVVLGVAGLNRFASNPWLNLGIAALFIVFALSLFGLLNLALPSGLVNALDRASNGSRFGRAGTALLMGVTFALTSFTCTAPFVGTLLTSAARGDWRWPAAGLFAYSSVFALPFFLLAMVPQALQRLPRSGAWLATLKGTLGFIELAAAMKFISNADLVQGWGVFTREAVVAIWAVLAGLLALYLFGVRPNRPAFRRALAHPIPATFALLVTVWLTTALGGRRLGELEPFLPPAGAGASGVLRGTELSWLLDDLDGALRAARVEQKLVLIDFTGFTCTNCRWMEANMFPRADVSRELEQFVRVRLFTDGNGERYKQQQALEQMQFRTVALPLYAIVDSLGRPRASFLGMTRDAREFRQFLSDVRRAN